MLDGNLIGRLALGRQREGLPSVHPPRGRPELIGPKFTKAAHSGVVGGILDPVDGAQGLPTIIGPGFNCKTEDGDQEEELCKESFHVAGDWHKEQLLDPDKQDFLQ